MLILHAEFYSLMCVLLLHGGFFDCSFDVLGKSRRRKPSLTVKSLTRSGLGLYRNNATVNTAAL